MPTRHAYWSYLNRYPNGPHASDRAAAVLSCSRAPTAPFFPEEVYGRAAPPEEEIYITRPALAFDDQDLGFAPPRP